MSTASVIATMGRSYKDFGMSRAFVGAAHGRDGVIGQRANTTMRRSLTSVLAQAGRGSNVRLSMPVQESLR